MEKEITAVQETLNMIVQFIVRYGFQVLGAIIILILGIIAARWLAGAVLRLCEKKNIDITLSKFLGNVTKIVVMVFVIIIAIGKFGISIAPFIAAIGAMAFGGSFALQGPLSNYGAGLTLVLTRPFVVGNTISVNQVGGVVEEIALAATQLITEDGERITIPNKHIVGEILVNSFANKVVESTVGISYDDDPIEAIDCIRETLTKMPHVVSDPLPQIGIEAFGDSAINIGMRYWVPTEKYFQTAYAVNLAIYGALKEAKITIPYPQRDVHMLPPPSTV